MDRGAWQAMVHRVTESQTRLRTPSISEEVPSSWVLLHAEYSMILLVQGIFTCHLGMCGFPLNWLPLVAVCLLLCKGNPRTLTFLWDPDISLGPHIRHPIPLTFIAPTLTLNGTLSSQSRCLEDLIFLFPPLHFASPLVSRKDLTSMLRSPISPGETDRPGTQGLDKRRRQPFCEFTLAVPYSKLQVSVTSSRPLLQEALRECGWP